jgi:hypothetical protein
LDSICPTGLGKVAAAKIETDEEDWADGAEVPRQCRMQSGECKPAINGISREKARAVATLWRGKQKAQKQLNRLRPNFRLAVPGKILF